MYRVSRTGNGAYYGSTFHDYNEAKAFYDRTKGCGTHGEFYDDNGTIEKWRKQYVNGKGYVLIAE